MLDEKHNESFHWRKKLDELDHLATEPAVDKAELWKRLHARLSQKRNKTKPAWYWTAAACLLVAIGISWFLANEKTGKPVTEKTLPLPQQPSNEKIARNNEAPKVDTQHINVIAKEGEKPRVIISNIKNGLPKVSPLEEQIKVSNLPDVTDSLQVVDRNTVRPADTVSFNSITATPPRRRLRVIHINELEKQVEQEIKYAGTALPSAKSKNSADETIPAFSLSKNASDNIVKIKLSPSN